MLGHDVPEGKLTSSPCGKRAEDEVVVFSWITWPRSSARQGWKKAMEDPRMPKDMSALPSTASA